MEKSITEYQKCFNSIVYRLKKNEFVVAILVFGSMVNGDLWHGSDIDFLIVVNDENLSIENIYTDENGIPVHLKVTGKKAFISMYKDKLLRKKFNLLFRSSKLVFSKDKDIIALYDNVNYYNDLDREIWNLAYLGKILKYMSICKKYIANDRVYRAYVLSIKCLEQFAKLYVNHSGYIVSKDAIIVAMNLDDNFKNQVEDLFFSKSNKIESVKNIIKFLDNSINENIMEYTRFLVEYIKGRENPLSVEDIKKEEVFANFHINMKDILVKLWEKKIVKRKKKDYKVNKNIVLFEEWAYFL
ncbi:nucleotidyltransferase domain protein [Clostridium acetireducens DSM 10703]|uniref:Nucleotidyltransferase domain protein n=1 Tax=Clostridium acetireducens DSM 10703 TaxID=1121290 RepID=A0A1E8EWE1_9CLOT|nr:nucleotidyltransferase domain-containing protein [Clostridium acetireducens]OFI04955.1 nucleotidyltransferase domain protein [Clostridium acetireducens DSM 10703]